MALGNGPDQQVLRSFPANADLSSYQFYFVKLSSGKLVVCTAAGENALGVLQDDPSAADQPGSVCLEGITKVKAGGSITAGNPVKTSSAGKAVAATAATVNTSDTGAASDAVVGSYVLGIALTDASDGDLVEIQLAKMGTIPTTAA